MTVPVDAPVRLGPLAVEMLEGIYQHRLLSAAQLHAIYTPGRSREWAHRQIRKLERVGLAAAVRQPGGRKLLHLTPAGLAMVEAVPRTESRSKLITPEHAAGALQRHTLAVNDVGIAFLRAARERGDGFGPLSWRHEIAHPIGSPVGGRRNEQVIADAMLVYEHYEGRSMSFRYRFLELDRNTMPVHALGMKLARYARLFGYRVPSKKSMSLGPRFWETRYRVFPTVMLVLDNGTPRQLRHRGENALWFAGTEKDMRDAPKVKVLACLLSDLQAEGPFARIFRGMRDPGRPVDWLGRGEHDEHDEKDGDGE
ncbi:MAG: replication-relaxation family protein [Patulibacter sp.]|nr:replication-relaxation family protein [Patulibacter sp.]